MTSLGKQAALFDLFGGDDSSAVAPEEPLVPADNETKKKTFGRVYTPRHIVEEILNLSGYAGEQIIGRHVIDNSCGDGAFLTEIVRRYCEESPGSLKEDLERFVHGIEIDDAERMKCVQRLDAVAAQYGVFDVRWNIICADTLTVDKYDGKMDYVLGNPPYIRVHNLGKSFHHVKQFEFSQGGMTDLYLVFYEIGLKMLAPNGVLGYITPSSFFNSLAGAPLRKYLVKNNLLEKLADLGHYQAFTAAAYTTIAILRNNRTKETTEVYEYDGVLKPVDVLRKDDFFFNNNFYFSTSGNLQKLREIFSLGANGRNFEVKNGFATLADSFFIGDDLNFEHTIPVVKASTGKWTRCLFPYADEKLIPFEKLAESKELEAYYAKNAAVLTKRSIASPDEWHGFGRTQGIKDVYKPKVAVNTLLRDVNDIKLVPSPPGTGVYSGLYVLSELSYDEIKALICTSDFVNYVSLLKKYKSGGYYAFSSKDLKRYLEYADAKRRSASS